MSLSFRLVRCFTTRDPNRNCEAFFCLSNLIFRSAGFPRSFFSQQILPSETSRGQTPLDNHLIHDLAWRNFVFRSYPRCQNLKCRTRRERTKLISLEKGSCFPNSTKEHQSFSSLRRRPKLTNRMGWSRKWSPSRMRTAKHP